VDEKEAMLYGNAHYSCNCEICELQVQFNKRLTSQFEQNTVNSYANNTITQGKLAPLNIDVYEKMK
jgi:hypothetical protein